MTGITEHLTRLNERISRASAVAKRDPNEVMLLAVSKTSDMYIRALLMIRV